MSKYLHPEFHTTGVYAFIYSFIFNFIFFCSYSQMQKCQTFKDHFKDSSKS